MPNQPIPSVTAICPTCAYPYAGAACDNPACPSSGNISREAWEQGAADLAAETEEREARMRLYASSFNGQEPIPSPAGWDVAETSVQPTILRDALAGRI